MSTADAKSIADRNYHLDALRGLAALVVVFDHLHQHLFVPLGSAHGITRILYLDHYFAGVAVMLFFVLSGYLVGGSVVNNARSGRWSWGNYLVNRFSRLYIVLLPALLWTLLLDTIGNEMTLHRIVWFASPDCLRDMVGSAIFLQGVCTAPFGNDGALWSLSYEFWFYILFPPLVLLLNRRSKAWANLLLLLVLSLLVRGAILYLFPCWVLGAGIGAAVEKWPRLGGRAAFCLAAGTSALVMATVCAEGLHLVPFYKSHGPAVMLYMDAAAVAPFLWIALKAPPASSALYRGAAVLFSEMSYTLYLTHEPFLMFLRKVWLKDHLWPSDLKHVAMMVFPYCAALGLAYLLYLLFERRTDKVRGVLKAMLLTSKSTTQPMAPV